MTYTDEELMMKYGTFGFGSIATEVDKQLRNGKVFKKKEVRF